MCNGPEQNWINDSRKGYQFYVAAFNYHKVVENKSLMTSGPRVVKLFYAQLS